MPFSDKETLENGTKKQHNYESDAETNSEYKTGPYWRPTSWQICVYGEIGYE